MKNKVGRIAVMSVVVFSVLIGYRIWLLNNSKYLTVDPVLKEISGIEYDKRHRLWAINDGDNGAKLYQVNDEGKVVRTITIENAKNWDWEDMTQDYFGHFFIGDFGNNDKDREWLTIYKIENPIDIKTDTTTAEIIKFTYPEYSSKGDVNNHNYDIEAFIYYNKSLYLFTKNRTQPFDGKTTLYRIGDVAANYKAEFVSNFSSCTYVKELCWITSAALSPDRSKLVLLDSERLWLFENWKGDDFFSGDVYEIELGIVTQKEAVTFYDDNTIIFSDEEFWGMGRNIYMIKLDKAIKLPIKIKQQKATQPDLSIQSQ